MMLRRILAAVVVAAASVACAAVAGLGDYEVVDTEAGVSSFDGGGDGAQQGDGRVDAPNIVCAPSTCSPPQAPLGFGRVVFVDGTDPCPAGHDAVAAIEGPVADGGACGCGACAVGIDCSKGNLGSSFGSGQCSLQGYSFGAADGGCTNFGGNVTVQSPSHIVAPPAVIGACSAPSTPVRANVATSPRTLCTLSPSACPADGCPALTGLQRSCLLGEGDVACPTSHPEKHVVGVDLAITCPACGCTATATCGGYLQLYDDNNCSGNPDITLDAGKCNPSTQTTVQSRRWTGLVAGQTCTTTAASPTLDLIQKKTICCP